MRYSRQEKLNFIPKGFQEQIKKKKIILIGCGGIGSVLGQLLVRGGFENLVLVDNDFVDETNLQRQTYFERDIGKPKAQVLREHLLSINKNSCVEVYYDFIDKNNISKICKLADLVLDATDNFETRKIINNFCVNNKKDWIYSGAVKTEFICIPFYWKNNNFEKILKKKNKDVKCCEVGVLASTTYACASLVYNNVLKYFLGDKQDELIKINLWTNKLHKIKI